MDRDASTLMIAWTLFTHVIVPLAVVVFVAVCVAVDNAIKEQRAGERLLVAGMRATKTHAGVRA
jgi:hypothetical protein